MPPCKNGFNQRKRSKQITLRRFQASAIAASIAVLLAVGIIWWNSENTSINNDNNVAIETKYGQKQSVLLPDGSQIILNAQSTVRYNQEEWLDIRKVNLEGEAFFQVKKGSSFTVETSQGNIKVLGTSFNVKARAQVFEVICYTGKVEVSREKYRGELSQGHRVRIENPNTSSEKELNLDTTQIVVSANIEEPMWVEKGYSEFKNVPLAEVLEELKLQYNVKITGTSPRLDTIRYTVDMPHDDAQTAIQAIMEPLNIQYNYNITTKELKLLD